MRKFAAAALTAMLALLVSMWSVPSAQAYPEPGVPTFHIKVNHKVMYGGVSFVGFAKANVKCQNWTLSFLSQSASGSGKTFSHKFSTPKVTKKTTYPMHATCTYSVASASNSRATSGMRATSAVATTSGVAGLRADSAVNTQPAAAGQRTWSGEIPITLLPRHADNGPQGSNPPSGGILPNTGGPTFWVLVIGLALLIGGGATVLTSRRRASGSR